jgi:transcriptional regulator with XRE-family HTH domain
VKQKRNNVALKKFGKKVRAMRMLQNISQRQFAFDADIELSILKKIEKGEVNTGITTIISIASALDIPPKDLLDF